MYVTTIDIISPISIVAVAVVVIIVNVNSMLIVFVKYDVVRHIEVRRLNRTTLLYLFILINEKTTGEA